LKKGLTLKDKNFTAILTHIYIRKYDPSEYGKYKGDVDFIIDDEEYANLKEKVINKEYAGAEMYQRTGWDTIQITKGEIDVVSYLSTLEMAEKLRVKFDDLTNL